MEKIQFCSKQITPTFYQVTLTIVAIFLSACGSENDPGDCPAGDPLPIFSAENPGLTNYRFSERSGSTIEEFTYQSQADISITQSGCQKVVQLFRFTVPVDSLANEDRRSLTHKFRMLAGMGRDYSMYAQYANAMDELLPAQLRRGESYELQPGMAVIPDWLMLGTDREIISAKLIFDLSAH